ncbi:MAG: M61 family peptidase, partial [Thiotrichaceae bacterium]|nr:M61 family peptidase [Thiotrichaceae bacterium]
MIHYKISSANPAGHYFDITLTVPAPDPSGQVLRLPAWIPGSYMIRDFARNIIEIDALSNNVPVTLIQQDKSSWLLENCAGPAT